MMMIIIKTVVKNRNHNNNHKNNHDVKSEPLCRGVHHGCYVAALGRAPASRGEPVVSALGSRGPSGRVIEREIYVYVYLYMYKYVYIHVYIIHICVV